MACGNIQTSLVLSLRLCGNRDHVVRSLTLVEHHEAIAYNITCMCVYLSEIIEFMQIFVILPVDNSS